MASSTQIALWTLIATGLVGCKFMDNPGDPLSSVEVTAPVGEAPAAPMGPQGDFDFDGQDRPESEMGADIDRELSDEDLLALQARANGLDPDKLSAPEPAPAAPALAAPAPVVAVPMAAPNAVPVWDPAMPLPTGSWGVKLLATLHDVQPPRAVLGLPDGAEIVVQPGTFIVEHRLVVIAVGRDVIQLSKVTPQGFYAKVETETIQSLFPPAAAN
jgi:hypothetical protein